LQAAFQQDASDQNSESISMAIIPGVDGSLYYGEVRRGLVGEDDDPEDPHAEHSDGTLRTTTHVERLPISAREIVDAAPFEASDGTRFIASKEATVMVIDRDSGVVRQAMSPKSSNAHVFSTCFDDEPAHAATANPGSEHHNPHQQQHHASSSSSSSSERGQKCASDPEHSHRRLLWLTRVELMIQAIDAKTGKTRYFSRN
jgi:hypothetical protein